MPPFSANTTPSIVGVYVDKFIDPPGMLSILTVTSGGTGYVSSNPPTVTITGGGGSGAVIDPVIQNGQIVALRYRHDPNLGALRGSGYNTIAPAIGFSGGVGLGASANVQLSKDTTILGVTANENALLQFCLNNQINYLALYTLSYMNWGSSTSTSLSSPGTNLLASFMTKARLSGITSFGAVRSGSNTTVNQIITYNNQRTSANERFEWFNIENEWWNGAVSFSTYLTNIQNAHNLCTGTTHPMGVEIYIGWPSAGQMVQLVPYLERILVHDYSSSKIPDYNYTQGRMIDIGNACNTVGKTIDVMPIFSAEKIISPWNADYDFMGLYYTTNTIYNAYYSWAVPYVSTPKGSYNYESNTNVRNRLNPVGHIIFDQSLLRVSNPPTPPPATGSCVASISALGSTTVPVGGSVRLRATNGLTYLWSPSGETIQEITATTSGNYYAQVGNGTCTATTNTISVTITPNIFEVDVLPDGPLYFNAGLNVSLSATTIITGASESYVYNWFSATTSAGTYTSFYSSNPLIVDSTGYYYVGVSGLTSSFSANSEVVFVNAAYIANPGGGQTEETTETVINSAVSYTDSDTTFPWLAYRILLLDVGTIDYYVFVKIKTRDTITPTGIKVSIDGGNNFASITDCKSTTYQWYRLGIPRSGFRNQIYDQISIIYFQANNNKLMFTQFAVSSDPDFIPGPYPI